MQCSIASTLAALPRTHRRIDMSRAAGLSWINWADARSSFGQTMVANRFGSFVLSEGCQKLGARASLLQPVGS